MNARQAGPTCCAVILAGGRNSRMQGRNKAFLTIDGRTILDRLLDTLGPIFPEVLLVTRQPELYTQYPVKVVQDLFKARSSLTGIHSGLAHADTQYAFVTACDAPFLMPALVRFLVEEIEPAIDAVVPFIAGYHEPLCAVYSKECTSPIEEQLKRGEYRIIRFFEMIRLKRIEEEKIKTADPHLRSFLNINTPEALEALKKNARKK